MHEHYRPPSSNLTESLTELGHPLTSIWFEPAATIMRISAADPGRFYFSLAAVWGASSNLSLALSKGIPAETLTDAGISSP